MGVWIEDIMCDVISVCLVAAVITEPSVVNRY